MSSISLKTGGKLHLSPPWDIYEAVEFGEVKLYYVPTDQQYADIFTKNLAKLKFETGRKALHLIKHSEYEQ